MNTVIVWILVMTSGTGIAVLPDRFTTKEDCMIVSISAYQQSKEARNARYVHSHCIQAKVIAK